ncbi:MAG: hypothetical protein PCFJNLEI_00344 [Verrucomicrobiae bacterium]|nr:hypothetical protein [Verrucomicrobiae bacterium]
MQLHYDAELIEGIVFLEVRRSPALLALRYDRARTKLYDLPGDEREAAFFQLHLHWFRELGLEDKLRAVLQRFPIITANTATLLVRRTVTKKDEGAELFVRPDAKNVAIAFRCERLFEPGFESFLAHELCHVSDMLDPSFAYEPEIRLTDAPPAEVDLLRERYRVLWDITIDGRLNQNRAARFAEFQKVMPTVPEQKFAEVWRQRPPHPELLALAKSVLVRVEKTPGAPCPLCKFPTFVWATEPPVVEIGKDFPHWLPAHGCCARCAELYSTGRLEQPAPLYI